MNKYKTNQELFWAGEFGDSYVERNNTEKLFSSQLSLWNDILRAMSSTKSFIEFGANVGLNLKAIHMLIQESDLSAIEINEKAANEIKKLDLGINVFNESILNFKPARTFDVTIASGVLIHQNPENLRQIYELLYQASEKYIVINEYYSPNPVEVEYRGYSGKLFKRDFAGEMMDMFPNLRLVQYGFRYHRDNLFPQDDSTWFVLSK